MTNAEQEKIRSCLKDLSENLGFAYENTQVRDGSVTLLYVTPNAKGPVVLKDTNEHIKPLGELFMVLQAPMASQDRWKRPALENSPATEAMTRTNKLQKNTAPEL